MSTLVCVCHTYILAAALSLSVFRSRTLEDRKEEEEEERILLASDVGKPYHRRRCAAAAAATAAVAIPRWRRRRW